MKSDDCLVAESNYLDPVINVNLFPDSWSDIEPVRKLKSIWHAHESLEPLFQILVDEIVAVFNAPLTTLEGSIGLQALKKPVGLELQFADRRFILKHTVELHEDYPFGKALLYEIKPPLDTYPYRLRDCVLSPTDQALYFDQSRQVFFEPWKMIKGWKVGIGKSKNNTLLHISNMVLMAYES